MLAASDYHIEVKTASGEICPVYCFVQEKIAVGRAPGNDLVVTGNDVKEYAWDVYFMQDGVRIHVLDDTDTDEWIRWQIDQWHPLGNQRLTLRKRGAAQAFPSASATWGGWEALQTRLLNVWYWLRGGLENAVLRFLIYACALLGIAMLLPVLLRIDEQNWAAASVPVAPSPTSTFTSTFTPTPPPTPTPSATPTTPPTATATATHTATPTFTPTPTLTPLPDTTATLYNPVGLASLGVTPVAVTVPSGAEYWKVINVERLTGELAEGRQGIMVEVFGANGRDTEQRVVLLGPERQPLDSRATTDKPSTFDYACQFPMFNPPPTTYGVYIQGLPSERVEGLAIATQAGVPVNTGFLITFQRTRR